MTDHPTTSTDDEGIPEFLRVENRTPVTVKPVARPLPPPEEEWQKRNRLASEARAAARKAKNERGLERMKLRHPGERYDRKTKTWVPV